MQLLYLELNIVLYLILMMLLLRRMHGEQRF